MKKTHQWLSYLLFLRRTALSALKLTTFLVCSGIVYFSFLVLLKLVHVPNLSYLEHYRPEERIEIYDRYDRPISQVDCREKRKIVPLAQISVYLQRAILAAEDHHFYEHNGFYPASILRACLANLHARRVVEGGSTITQQLVKNLFFDGQRRSLELKVAEILVASSLEQKYSKEKILELYLNEVYFGNGAYGVEQAARTYFAKSAYELTIAESAFIAALIKSPSTASLVAYRPLTISSQREILDKMVAYRYISYDQGQIAKAQTLVFKSSPSKKTLCRLSKYPYYISYVLELVNNRFSEAEILRHGLRVYTNLDQAAQEIAERTLVYGIRRAPPGVNQAALVSINVKDGAVIALVGGMGNYMKNQWNCAVNRHTVGSAFKPFVYLTALARGVITPSSFIDDSPLSVKQAQGPDYKPHNFDRKFLGPITATQALALSRNVCAVRLAQEVGIGSIIETARLAGIKQEFAPHLSLALGCSAASPLEMASAYATFARGGLAMRPSVLRRIENKSGEVLEKFEPWAERVFSPNSVAQLVDMLQDVVSQGTGKQAKLANRPVAGKTGTADQAKDLWFIGFTPDLVTAIWGGNSDNKPIAGIHVTGGTVMAKIWHDYNQLYYATYPAPPGCFIASTKTNEHYETATVSEVPKTKQIVVPYTEQPVYARHHASYAANTASSPTGGVAMRTQKGITEYRWSSSGY